MKIAYLIDYDLTQTSGVVQKIKQQSMEWNQQGHTVYLVSMKKMTIYDTNQNVLFSQKTLNMNFGKLGTAIKLLYNSYYLKQLLSQIEVDCIYMRYQMYMPFMTQVLKNHKVIMEINSDDLIEYKLHSKLTYLYNKFTRKQILKCIDTFVAVSHELKEKFMVWNKPISVIANGIDTRQYSIGKAENSVPTLVFIGTPNQPWHGLNKILKMAQYFKEYQFYIIGTSDENRHNVHYFGYLAQNEATKIIQKSDVGIGTLSLYETGLTEASPLKTRQYLACGLPIIYAYNDTDLTHKSSFALQLDNREDNIDYIEIERFINTVFHQKSIALEAREFAENSLDYALKEQQRLTFFQKVIDG
jgi:glycosyltransferase involved in cell wall biosynthesis